MKSLKIKKGPILLPLLALVLALGVYTLCSFGRASAANNLSVGQQRLNEMDYGGAVASFTQAIEIDPTNREARIGLAQAYAGAQDYDVACQVLDDMVYTEKPDPEATRVMIELLEEDGQTHQALSLAQDLVEASDADEDYARRDALLQTLLGQKRSLAQGTDQSLLLTGGAVLARGSNTLGQLGLTPSEGTEEFVSARFAGTPAKVACVGRTSLVVDAAGGLWAAGENRWGQMGEGYAVTAPQEGWRQVPCTGNVADVAGTTGRLLVLLDDGTLLGAGAGSGQTLQRLTEFSTVTAIAANRRQAVVLTAAGRLYRSYSDTPADWETVARDVRSFTLSEDTLCWVGADNRVFSEGSSLQLPASWWTDSGLVADIDIDTLAAAGGLTLCTTSGGSLCRLTGERVQPVETVSAVSALYPVGRLLVLEYADGSAAYWSAEMAAPAPLEEYRP